MGGIAGYVTMIDDSHSSKRTPRKNHDLHSALSQLRYVKF